MLFEVSFPWIALASIFVVAIFLGRALCGWACPFGSVQDLLTYIKKRHTEVTLRTHRDMVKVKYLVLAVILFVSGTLAVSLAIGVGEGAEIRIPMARAVAGGLIAGTFLTLFLVPVLYSLFERVGLRRKRAPEKKLT